MARNDFKPINAHSGSADVRATSWHALAHAAVASTLVVAIVVSVFAIIEFAIEPSASPQLRAVAAAPRSVASSTAPSQPQAVVSVSD